MAILCNAMNFDVHRGILIGSETRFRPRGAVEMATRIYALCNRMTRFLHANRHPPRIQCRAGFGSKAP
jgi:hypothetical protein